MAKPGVARVSFMIAKRSLAQSLQALLGTKGLHTRNWFALPQDIDLELDEILDVFLDCSFWDKVSKVCCK